MDREQIELVGTAFLAGHHVGRCGESRIAPGYSRIAPGYERPWMVHKVPRRPIRLDGDSCQPRIVQKFDGHPLYWVLDKTALEGGEVSVFTRPDHAKQFRDSLPRAPEDAPSSKNEIGVSAQALTAGVTLSGYVVLHEHINFGGDSWLFWAGWGNIPDFTRVYPPLGYSINDLVSSVDTNIRANPPGVLPWTVLHEHINFAGSQLWIPNDIGLVDDLRVHGWNDIASSMSYEA
jgi:hypothetical protein